MIILGGNMKLKALIKYLYLLIYITITFLAWTISFNFAGIGLFIFIVGGALIISFFYGILSYVITKKIIVPSCLITAAIATYLLFGMAFDIDIVIYIVIFALLCGVLSLIMSVITFAFHKFIKKMVMVRRDRTHN